MKRGRVFERCEVTVQKNVPVKSPGGTFRPNWIAVRTDTCAIIPLSASDRARFSTETLVVTHKARWDHDPGFDVPGLWRLLYPAGATPARVLTYQGHYNVHELGRTWTMILSEDSQQRQFQT